jgi:hypothetical protein
VQDEPAKFALAAACILVLLPCEAWPQAGEPPATKASSAETGPSPDGTAGGDEEEARVHFTKGVDFFKAGDFSAALVEFLRSYELNPVWGVKFNIAVCYLKLNKYTSSLAAYKAYMEEGGDKIPEDRKAKVIEDLAFLEATVGRVSFCCGVEGSALVVDDVEPSEVPAEGPLLMDPGIHKVELRKERFEPFITKVTVVAGEETSVQVTLVPEKKKIWKPVGGAAAKPHRKPLAPSTVALIAGLGGFALVGVGAITTGALVLTTRDRMKEEAHRCDSTLTREDCPEAYTLYDRARDLKLASNILTALSLASAAAGLTAFFVLRAKEKKAKPKEAVVEASWAPVILPGIIAGTLTLRY